MEESLLKKFSLYDEMETSTNLIKLGFGELQNINPSNRFYFLPFQLLSQGFERFMKCYICLAYFNKNQVFPNFEYVKDQGHDLVKLLDFILTDEFTTETDVQIEQKSFLETDPEFKQLLRILSEFGKYARYYNFDIITEKSTPTIDPKKEWQEFENMILHKNLDYLNKILDWNKDYEIPYNISSYIIAILERFIQLLSLQISMGFVGDEGKVLLPCISDFVFLKDYGTANYRKNTARYKNKQMKIYTGEEFEKQFQLFNETIKEKKIKKEEYKGDWPFLAEEVIIERRDNNWYIAVINNFVFALNGHAQRKYKLEFPLEAGFALPGKTVGDFIKIAGEL